MFAATGTFFVPPSQAGPPYPRPGPLTEEVSLDSGSPQLPWTTVLVVEDEASVRQLCARVLEEEGYRVLTAGDGLEALAILEAAGAEIHLVISDLRMPRLDGFQLSAQLAARRAAPPVIFISGYSLDRPIDRPILPKPFRPADLLAAVERVLHNCHRVVSH